MKTDSKFFRIVFVSPWLLTFFLVISLLFILSVTLKVRVPLAGSKDILLFNNAFFTILVALRFLYYLARMPRAIRYGAGNGIPRKSVDVAQAAGAVRGALTAAGYLFDEPGAYAEKRDRGYLGTTVLYAGLFVVLFTGTLDNMRQFSGTLLYGIGVAADLNQMDKYRQLLTGPLALKPTSLPKMKIIRQFMPDATYPRGATEMAFLDAKGKERKVILKSPDPFRVGAYDIYMSKMAYEPQILVTIDNDKPVFTGTIHLDPLVKKENGFGFYGAFAEGNLDGEAYYQPEKSRLRLILRQGDLTLMDRELIFQVDRQQTMGNISFTCERMGVWSEIHVVRRRHMPLILFGGIVAFIGLVMRVAIRPQRVWLEEAPAGCRVRAVGGEAMRLVKGE